MTTKKHILCIIGVSIDKTLYTSSCVMCRHGKYIKNSHVYAHAYEYNNVSDENVLCEDVIISPTKNKYTNPWFNDDDIIWTRGMKSVSILFPLSLTPHNLPIQYPLIIKK